MRTPSLIREARKGLLFVRAPVGPTNGQSWLAIGEGQARLLVRGRRLVHPLNVSEASGPILLLLSL